MDKASLDKLIATNNRLHEIRHELNEEWIYAPGGSDQEKNAKDRRDRADRDLRTAHDAVVAALCEAHGVKLP